MTKPWTRTPATKWISAGCVVVPSFKQYSVYLIKPANNWGPWGLPKGRMDPGEVQEQTAVREVREETGLQVEIIPSTYLGVYEGLNSFTHYYLARRVGGKPEINKEVCAIHLMSFSQALLLLKNSGNVRDWKVLTKAWNKFKAFAC